MDEKKKVLLAIGHRELEEFLQSSLKGEFLFIGTTVYREGIVRAIEQSGADIVVIRETLNGTENIMSIVYKIRTSFPDIRIVFLAGKREVGDALLANLVNYGVYDVLYGENIQAQKIIKLIKDKNSYNDVKYLQPMPELDENKNKMIFKAPEFERPKEEGREDEEYEYEYEDEEKDEGKSKAEEREPKRSVVNIKFPQIVINKKPEKEIEYRHIETINERIITFFGGKSGTGTTSLAINTAFSLAKSGKKVIYVELNERYPAVSYWYELGYIADGIDTFLEKITDRKYEDAKSAIVKGEYLRETDSQMSKNYKKFPKTLDYLFFSKEYLLNMREKADLSLSKELYLHLLYQLGYDFVIIDVPSDLKNEATLNAIVFSNKVFTVVTQDVSSVGYSLFNINNLEKEGIEMKNKNVFIVNRYTDCSFTEKDIKEWIGAKDIITINEYSEEFIDANLKGLPVCLNTKNKRLLDDIEKISNNILIK